MRFAAVVLLGAALVAQEARQQPTFRGGARFVRVDVYPTDAAGKPIEGLTAADFELFEDGKPQAIETFEFVRVEREPEIARVDPNSQVEGEALAKDPRARVFAIVLDTRHVDIAAGRAMRRPLVEMLDQLIGPRDMFGVITPQLPVASFVLGRRTGTVADMMERYWYWGVDDSILAHDNHENLNWECSMVPNENGQRLDPLIVEEIKARHRERDTLRFLDSFVDKLKDIRDERKAVIVVTQGWRLFTPNREDIERVVRHFESSRPQTIIEQGRIRTGMGSNTGTQARSTSECVMLGTDLLNADTRNLHRELMTKAQRANVAFYPVDPRGLPTFDASINEPMTSLMEDQGRLQSRVESLRVLAINTDGIAFVRSNDLSAQLSRLADSLSAYYLLGYYSTNTKFDGGYRRLQVKVSKPGVRMQARRGYFAPTEAEIAAIAEGRAAADRPGSPEAIAMAEALARLERLGPDADLFVQAVRLPGRLVVGAELGVRARTADAWSNGGEIRFVISGAGVETVETSELQPMRSGARITVPIDGDGPVQVDVRARAAAVGERSAAETVIEIPGPSLSLLGGVMSYRGLARALMPAADGRYRRTERATIEAPLADGAVPAGARVLDKTGQPLNVPIATRERADAGGVRWLVAEASLAPLTDGDYVIEMEAMKDERRERRLFAIRVVR